MITSKNIVEHLAEGARLLRELEDVIFLGRTLKPETRARAATWFTADLRGDGPHEGGCTGCGAPHCGHLWPQQKKCCPDCSHTGPVSASSALHMTLRIPFMAGPHGSKAELVLEGVSVEALASNGLVPADELAVVTERRDELYAETVRLSKELVAANDDLHTYQNRTQPTALEALAHSWWTESQKSGTVIDHAGIWQKCAYQLREAIIGAQGAPPNNEPARQLQELHNQVAQMCQYLGSNPEELPCDSWHLRDLIVSLKRAHDTTSERLLNISLTKEKS